jgi:tripartite-type tricarboxylate transporter receptor subunit TctC
VRRHTILGLFAVLLAACAPRDGRYPSREVKLVVQASPGGISDTVSRVMASLMEKRLGVPVVCENRPGATGALAFSYVTRRPPDGYTLGHGPVEISMVRTLGYADVGPDRMDLLCLVSKTKPVLVVRAGASWRNLPEFLEAARAAPGRLIIANSGTGSIWHFNALLLEERCKVRVTHVPFGGSSAAIATLLGGHVDAVVAGAGEVVSHVQSGRLRVLSVFDPARSALFPDAPTAGEDGCPLGAGAWSGFYAPAGLPQPVRETLQQAFREAFETPEFQKLCLERGMEAVFLDEAQFRAFALAQAAFFSREIPRLLRLSR